MLVEKKLSLIMIAKNASNYIDAAIKNLQVKPDNNWELVFVDDHSTDHTKNIIQKYAENDKRISVFSNPETGKVAGTSFAFSKTSGDFIKCIDADDILMPEFFDTFYNMKEFDAFAHSCLVVDANMQYITTYHLNSAWFRMDYENVVENLISFPKFSWCFSRSIADKLFPLPADLPFEDVWMSLLIKRHARHPMRVRKPLYLYRQHSNQTFGGILNYSPEAVTFRAKRLMRLIEVLEKERRINDGLREQIFKRARRENMFLLGETGPEALLYDFQLRGSVAKLLLKRYFPHAARTAAKMKWAIEGWR